MGREQRGLGLLPSFSSTSTHTLEKLRRDSFRPSRESDLNRFMLEIAMGMDYLHEHGVLHGDLKVRSPNKCFLNIAEISINSLLTFWWMKIISV